jgi:hypothetical protein
MLALCSNSQPGGSGLHIYIPCRLGGPVIPPGTEYQFKSPFTTFMGYSGTILFPGHHTGNPHHGFMQNHAHLFRSSSSSRSSIYKTAGSATGVYPESGVFQDAIIRYGDRIVKSSRTLPSAIFFHYFTSEMLLYKISFKFRQSFEERSSSGVPSHIP